MSRTAQAGRGPQKIYVAGHCGMVGSAIVRALLARGVLEQDIVTRRHDQLDLCTQQAVQDFFAVEMPTQVYLAAGRTGSLYASNRYPADSFYDNLTLQTNVIHAAHCHGVQKLLFLGNSCIYPHLAPQPWPEDALLGGAPEPDHESHAVVKIAGLKLCESHNRQYGRDYRSLIPAKLYGPGDNYHPENFDVIPALMRRFHEARMRKTPSVTIWGSGTSRREYLYVDDLAAACVHVMNLPQESYEAHTTPMQGHINVGCGSEITVAELAQSMASALDYRGEIRFDTSHADGAARKSMDSSRANALGWHPQVSLAKGLTMAYSDFRARMGDEWQQRYDT